MTKVTTTKIEALDALQEMENIIESLYNRRLDGEEIQPYIITAQRYRDKITTYILEHAKETSQRKEIVSLLKAIEDFIIEIYEKHLYGEELKPYINIAQNYKQPIEKYIKEQIRNNNR
jgi:hypothetical protein